MNVLKHTIKSGETFFVSEIDRDLLSLYKWRIIKSEGVYYPLIENEKRKNIFLKRIIGERIKGKPLSYEDKIVFKNKNLLDITRENLLVISQKEVVKRQERKVKHNPHRTLVGISGYRGISKTRFNTYYAQITYKKKLYYIGTYKTVEEACFFYNQKAKELFGEEAILSKKENILARNTVLSRKNNL